MVTFANISGYSNTYPTIYAINPRQPVAGDLERGSIAAEKDLFIYDIITPYGIGTDSSNAAQDIQYMVGWGTVVCVSVFTDQAVTLRLYADLYSGTWRLADTSVISLLSQLTRITFPKTPAFRLKGTIQHNGTPPTVFEFHSQIMDQ